MAIFERKIPKTGKTVFDVYVQDWNVHGKRVQKKRRGFESQRSAREAEAKLRAELMLEKGRPERVTWAMWVSRCIEQMKVTRRPSTVINYESTQRTWTVPVLGERYLDEITSSEIHRLVHEHVQGVTPSSRRSILDQTKRLFGMAVDEAVISRNPATGVTVTVPEPVKTVLRFEEAQRLLREAKMVDHKFYPVWAMALMTGMRSGELYATRWSDVDMEARRIFVRRSWCSKSGFGPTKSRKNRVVPISDSLMQLLTELRRRRVQGTPQDEDFVLPRIHAWKEGWQAAVLRDFCKSIGITSVKFHDLRATFITQMLLKGVSLAQVMAIVGHAELKTTTVYLRVTGADLDGATNRLNLALPQSELAQVIEFKPPACAAV